jgi:4'-phosphopantetheinyl transferase
MLPPVPWLPSPDDLQLPDEEVHVWRARLDLPAAELEQLHRVLSPDEQQKAARFHFEKDRQHYTVGRGFLRTILGRYLTLGPGDLRFSYNSFGKPNLAWNCGNPPLRFNLAHSHGMALFAFNRRRELGIDLESIRPDRATEEIAERFFAVAEVAALRSLPLEARVRAFFDCWTRKEAFIKARGMGLSLQLDKFAVTLRPGEDPALLSVADDPDAPRRWSLRNLEPANGYAAALVVEGHDWKLKCFDVSP